MTTTPIREALRYLDESIRNTLQRRCARLRIEVLDSVARSMGLNRRDGVETGGWSRRTPKREAAELIAVFEGADLCCSLVATVEEALAMPHVRHLREVGPLSLGIVGDLANP